MRGKSRHFYATFEFKVTGVIRGMVSYSTWNFIVPNRRTFRRDVAVSLSSSEAHYGTSPFTSSFPSTLSTFCIMPLFSLLSSQTPPAGVSRAQKAPLLPFPHSKDTHAHVHSDSIQEKVGRGSRGGGARGPKRGRGGSRSRGGRESGVVRTGGRGRVNQLGPSAA